MGTSKVRLRSNLSFLPFSLPLHHSRDKLSQALTRFSVLQVTESWAGPENEANKTVLLKIEMLNPINSTTIVYAKVWKTLRDHKLYAQPFYLLKKSDRIAS